MASGKKRKKEPVMGVGPEASEARRAGEPAAKGSKGSEPKAPRSKSTGSVPVERGSVARVAPEASELRGAVGARARALPLDRGSEAGKPGRARPGRSEPAAGVARGKPAVGSRTMPAGGRGSNSVRGAPETAVAEVTAAALRPSIVGGGSSGASPEAVSACQEPRPEQVEPARHAADPTAARLEEARPAVADDRGSKAGKHAAKAVTDPVAADAPVKLGPISNDRTPVTKKIEKKPGAEQASALVSDLAVQQEATVSVEASAAAGNSVKPAARAPAAKATPGSEAATTVKAPGKPSSADQAAVELARAKPATPRPAERTAAAVSKPGKASSAARLGFKPQEFIVYPAHGVGQIVAIEEQEVAGFKLELFVISFIKDKMILKVPTSKAAVVGMRKLAEADVVKKAFDTLCGRARVKRTMWSRRAQEYEAKINSGDLVAIAEVVRDLFRSDTQPEQSYSERQLYEAALDRMTREIVAVQKLTETEAQRAIEAQLMKGPRRGKAEEVEPDEPEIEEAA